MDRSPTPCWARVRLKEGGYVFISVTPFGTTVRKSRWGFWGRKLFSANKRHAEETAASLLAWQSELGCSLPQDLRTLELAGFAAAALCSADALDLQFKIAASQLGDS